MVSSWTTAADSLAEEPLEPPPYGPLPVGSTRRAWGRRPADEAEAKAMASSLRLQILRLTLHEPRTNKEIATALGRNPASVLHHVRTLVDTGFLIEQPVRRGERGSREVPVPRLGEVVVPRPRRARRAGAWRRGTATCCSDLPRGGRPGGP